MKRVYEKPALYIERFMLTQSIASGCSPSYPDFGMPNQNSTEVCGWDVFPGFEIFNDLNICEFPGDAFEFSCYNAPSSGGFSPFATS